VVKHYKTPKCQGCAAFARCTRNKLGRLIERSEHQEAVDQNKGNIEQDPSTYKKRQAIIEHTYGTIKRQWGFSYILTKRGLKRASSDVGLMFTAYNLRRLMNSICKNILKAYLKELADLCFVITASLKLFSVLLLHAIFTAQFYLPRKSAAA
jgi:hypothetical protein